MGLILEGKFDGDHLFFLLSQSFPLREKILTDSGSLNAKVAIV